MQQYREKGHHSKNIVLFELNVSIFIKSLCIFSLIKKTTKITLPYIHNNSLNHLIFNTKYVIILKKGKGGCLMIRIAICDDDEIICNILEQMLTKIRKELQQDFEIDIFNTGEKLLNEITKQNGYHLIFQDIELEKCSGIDVVKYIREKMLDESTQIIFVTGKEGYERQLFDFRPIGFLEKPIEQKKVCNLMEKYFRIYGNSSELFTYKFGRDVYCENIRNILYFKSDGKQIIIKTLDKYDVFIGVLKNVENQLKNKGFFMPNRSYLVNYRLVRSFRPNALLMINGEIITISRSNKEKVANIQLKLENGEI